MVHSRSNWNVIFQLKFRWIDIFLHFLHSWSFRRQKLLPQQEGCHQQWCSPFPCLWGHSVREMNIFYRGRLIKTFICWPKTLRRILLSVALFQCIVSSSHRRRSPSPPPATLDDQPTATSTVVVVSVHQLWIEGDNGKQYKGVNNLSGATRRGRYIECGGWRRIECGKLFWWFPNNPTKLVILY